jgi:hypothetical protein
MEVVNPADMRTRRPYHNILLNLRNFLHPLDAYHALLLGGPDDEPELFDLCRNPDEQNNTWRSFTGVGEALCEQTLSFLESVGTPEQYLAPRREALNRWWRMVRS